MTLWRKFLRMERIALTPTGLKVMAAAAALLVVVGVEGGAAGRLGPDLAGGLRMAGPDGMRDGGKEPELTGTLWRLIEVVEPSGTWQPAPGAEATLRIEADGRLYGRACNSYSGPIRIDGDRLHVGDLMGTLMACPEPQAAVEDAFTDLLSGKEVRWSLNDGTLHLEGADGHALRFAATPPPEQA